MKYSTLMSHNGLTLNNCITLSAEDTIALGYQLGMELQENHVLCFFGDLGAGKTTFIKGIVQARTGIAPEEVSSPTFIYLNVYGKESCVYHFDLYRLHDPDEFLSLGFEDYFTAGGICCIEWSERIEEILPPNTIKITLSHLNEHQRMIEFYEISKPSIHHISLLS